MIPSVLKQMEATYTLSMLTHFTIITTKPQTIMRSSINLSSKSLLGFFTFLSLQYHAHGAVSILMMASPLLPAVDINSQTITAAPTFAPTLDVRDDVKEEQTVAWFSMPGVDNYNDIPIPATLYRTKFPDNNIIVCDTYIETNFYNIVNLDKCHRKPSSYYTDFNQQPDCDLKNNIWIRAWVNDCCAVNNRIWNFSSLANNPPHVEPRWHLLDQCDFDGGFSGLMGDV
ncbi:unnamed protein product [Clonostachys byssicola]|uniref:Uncharacterized protein n=1 Tax=Clonostachys byssicola TaxID=160290 RepID=A0A9N9UQK7_9HYPO|nr:unnamed protein product [Clonostachys byssicola]